MKSIYLIIFVLSFTLLSCSKSNKNSSDSTTNDSAHLDGSNNELIIKNGMPNDYFSDDGNVNITFFENGNIKEITIVSAKFNSPYDPVNGTGGVNYVTQRISYNEDQTLNLVSINADTNSTFWYSAHDGISICYDCDSVSYWN